MSDKSIPNYILEEGKIIIEHNGESIEYVIDTSTLESTLAEIQKLKNKGLL